MTLSELGTNTTWPQRDDSANDLNLSDFSFTIEQLSIDAPLQLPTDHSILDDIYGVSDISTIVAAKAFMTINPQVE